MPNPSNDCNNNNNNNNNKNSKSDSGKRRKLIYFILGAVLITIVVVGYHIYEYLFRGKDGSGESVSEHDIHELTKYIFAAELKHNRYLAKINYQHKTRDNDRDDHSPKPLLELHDDLLASDSSSTVYLMRRLFDNYEIDTQIPEQVTSEEQQEELEFLDAILHTAVMKRTMKYLHQKNYVTNSPNDQRKLLNDIWFTQYSRDNRIVGSSGFEHVFLAEIKNHQVILGLHNWVYFHEEEKKGTLNYMGWIERTDLGKDDQHLISLRFSFHNIHKGFNTLLIGTSPELEMSLYTVCFLMSPSEPCPVQLNSTKFHIITHVWDWRGKKTLAAAYPLPSFESPPTKRPKKQIKKRRKKKKKELDF